MARLVIRSGEPGGRWLELKFGVNRIGRGPDNHFQIQNDTVSYSHCEIVLSSGSLLIRDLQSTAGTYVDGEPVAEAQLIAGQTVRMGEVELVVENTEVKVAIPQFTNPELPAPPQVTISGALICPRHAQYLVSHRCTHCKELMCSACVHRLRRHGSRLLLELCPICSHAVESLGVTAKPEKKSLLKTVAGHFKKKVSRVIELVRNG